MSWFVQERFFLLVFFTPKLAHICRVCFFLNTGTPTKNRWLSPFQLPVNKSAFVLFFSAVSCLMSRTCWKTRAGGGQKPDASGLSVQCVRGVLYVCFYCTLSHLFVCFYLFHHSQEGGGEQPFFLDISIFFPISGFPTPFLYMQIENAGWKHYMASRVSWGTSYIFHWFSWSTGKKEILDFHWENDKNLCCNEHCKMRDQ